MPRDQLHFCGAGGSVNGKSPGQGLESIPEKKYFRIGEVCALADVKQHVLRYWETEFKPLIRPHRAPSKQRLYRRVDVENILLIKKLLKEDGFTISGARKFLLEDQQPLAAEPSPRPPDVRSFLSTVKAELRDIEKLLEEK